MFNMPELKRTVPKLLHSFDHMTCCKIAGEEPGNEAGSGNRSKLHTCTSTPVLYSSQVVPGAGWIKIYFRCTAFSLDTFSILPPTLHADIDIKLKLRVQFI